MNSNIDKSNRHKYGQLNQNDVCKNIKYHYVPCATQKIREEKQIKACSRQLNRGMGSQTYMQIDNK